MLFNRIKQRRDKKISEIIPKELGFTIEIPIYGSQIFFSFGHSFDNFNAMLCEEHRSNIDRFANGSDGYCQVLKNGGIIIRCKNYPLTSYDFEVLQHEIFHAIFRIMDIKGLKFTRESEEAYAYLNGFITRRVYDQLKISNTMNIMDEKCKPS